jgi:hypothetical protein
MADYRYTSLFRGTNSQGQVDYKYTNVFRPANDPGRQAVDASAVGAGIPSGNSAPLSNPGILGSTQAERLRNQKRREDNVLRPTTGTGRTEPGEPAGPRTPRDKTVYDSHSQRPEGPRPNPLDNYVNVTYGLSLHAIKPNRYNDIVGGSPYTTDSAGIGTVLIASGGRRSDRFVRNKHFQTDMYFESLKMTSVIGMNSRTRGSNVVEVSFTILEPFSVSFVERLLAVANDLDVPSWDQMFLMLQIDFFGNTDDGEIVNPLPDHTKYIPVKIIDVNIRVDTKGAEYKCTAIPASHTSMMESSASTPVIFEVLSKNLGDFFSSTGADVNLKPENNQREDTGGTNANPAANSVKIYSFVDAMNKHQRNLKDDKLQDTADEYKFVVPKSIASATVLHKPKINAAGNLPSQINNNQTKTSSKPDSEREVTRINAGTSVLDVANQMIRNSSYFIDQIDTENDGEVSTDTPIKAFKFLTEIKLGEWDKKRKKYQKFITYHIKEYSYYNTKFLKTRRSIPSKWVKEYYYMYTGKNQQIIDFTIDFNTMFITNVSAFADRKDRNQVNNADSGPSSAIAESDSGKIQTNRPNYVVSQTSVHATGTANLSKEAVAAGDLYKSMMSSSRGDMINVRLKIAGDPELIKQDDIFISPNRMGTEVMVGNSVNMDAGEVHAYLTFKTPEDINMNTGLYDGLDSGRNAFSGIYKIVTVDNEFSRGQFTQTLEMIRLFDQEDQTSASRRIDPRNIPASQGDLIAREQFAMANEAPAVPPPPIEQGDARVAETMATRTTSQTQTTPTPSGSTQQSNPSGRRVLPSFVPDIRPNLNQRLQTVRDQPVTPVTGFIPNSE